MKNKKIIAALIILVLFVIAWWFYTQSNSPIATPNPKQTAQTTNNTITNPPINIQLSATDFNLTKINYQQLVASRTATIAFQQQPAKDYHIGDFIAEHHVVEDINPTQVTLANYENKSDIILLKLNQPIEPNQDKALTKQERVKQVTDYFIEKALVSPPQTEEEANNLLNYFYSDKQRILDIDIESIEKSGNFNDPISLQSLENLKQTRKDIAAELAKQAKGE